MFTRSILLARYICLVETWILFFMIHKLENHINIMEFNILDVLRLHKSFFNLIFISCFSGPMFFRVRFSIFFRVHVFLASGFFESRFFRVRLQGPGPSFTMDPRFSGSSSRLWNGSKFFRVRIQVLEVVLKIDS